MRTFYYRTSSGEVRGATTEPNPPPPPAGLSAVTDPPVDPRLIRPDANDRPTVDYRAVRDTAGRFVGRAIYDGTTIRLATPAELDTFYQAQQADERQQEKQDVADKIEHPARGLAVRTLALVLLDEINLLRTQAGLQPRTKQQLVTAYKNKATSVDVDGP